MTPQELLSVVLALLHCGYLPVFTHATCYKPSSLGLYLLANMRQRCNLRVNLVAPQNIVIVTGCQELQPQPVNCLKTLTTASLAGAGALACVSCKDTCIDCPSKVLQCIRCQLNVARYWDA